MCVCAMPLLRSVGAAQCAAAPDCCVQRALQCACARAKPRRLASYVHTNNDTQPFPPSSSSGRVRPPSVETCSHTVLPSCAPCAPTITTVGRAACVARDARERATPLTVSPCRVLCVELLPSRGSDLARTRQARTTTPQPPPQATPRQSTKKPLSQGKGRQPRPPNKKCAGRVPLLFGFPPSHVAT